MITVTKTTPVLIVEAIEPCLPCWLAIAGYSKTAEVPHGAGLGFVILTHGASELMLQTRASLADDLPETLPHVATGSAMLFAEVKSIAAVREALAGTRVLVPARVTPYGAQETVVLAPGGQVTIFAEFP